MLSSSLSFLVSRISTRSPGWMKPPTPFTVFTGTVTARMPSAMMPESPARPFSPVIFAVIIGSPGKIVVSTRRLPSLMTSEVAVKAPSGNASCGQSTTLMLLELIASPNLISDVATTTLASSTASTTGRFASSSLMRASVRACVWLSR